MTKLLPIDISDCQDNIDSIMDKCSGIFQETIAYPYSRPKLKEREIFVSLDQIESKAVIFWHIASIEQKNKDVLPCTNDITVSLCKENCINGLDSIRIANEVREKCIYRATRVNWIKPVLEMYNSSDSRVKYWEKMNSNKKLRLYLRFQEDGNDYLVIFEHKSEKRVVLITAFPIFYVSCKRDYDKDYENYEKRKRS